MSIISFPIIVSKSVIPITWRDVIMAVLNADTIPGISMSCPVR